ncbi:unnamed protein product [Penicillium palitans]
MPEKRRHRGEEEEEEEEEPSVEDASARKRQRQDPNKAIRKQFEIFKDSNYPNDRAENTPRQMSWAWPPQADN